MLRKSTFQELVMNVTLVGLKERLAVAEACYDDTHDIEARHNKQGVGQKQTVAAVRHDMSVVHCELHHKETKDESERQTARIAHENLAVALGLTPQIEIKIGCKHAHKSRNKHTIAPHSLTGEAHEETQKRHERKPAGESVDTVNEVDGIVDEHYHEDGERCSHPERYLGDAAETVQIVYVKSRYGKQSRRHYLHSELCLRPKSHDVVDNSHDINHEKTYDEHERPKAQSDLLAPRHTRDNEYRHDKGKQHARQERHASQPRHRLCVHLASFGYVVEFALVAEVENARYDNEATNHAQHKCKYRKEKIMYHSKKECDYIFITAFL